MRDRQGVNFGIIVLALVTVGVAVFLISRSPAEPETPGLDAIQADMDAGNYRVAQGQLESFIEENEGDAEAHFKLGLVYFNLGDYAQARAQFLRSLELDPERASAVHHNLGVLAFQNGDLETALAEFKTALEVDPDDVDTHYQLGATYLLLAFPENTLEPDAALLEQARTEFEEALALAPDKPEALVGLANVAMLDGDVEAAIGLLEEAVKLAPDMREALFALGRAYAMLGRVDEAASTLQRFLATDPPQMWAEQAEQILGELSDD